MGNISYDLTNPQKSIWFTEEVYKGIPIENIAGSVIINEKVNFKLLDRAIKLFAKNNVSFNLKFFKTENSIKQCIQNFEDFPIDIIDVESNKDVKKLEKKLSNTPFDVLNSKLYSALLFKFPDNHGGFVISIHHLIADAWTSGLIIDGIINIYSELLKNPKKTDFEFPSYIDYIEAEEKYLNSEKFIKDKTFWNELYKSIPEAASIPSFNSFDGNKTYSTAAKRKVFTLPKETFELINNFSKKYKASPFNFFMGIIALYLGRVSSLDEFVIGTPILNRSTFKDKHTTGMFISTIPFKVTINHNLSFADFITNIGSNFFDIFRHQKYPYQYLLEDLRKQNSAIPNLYDVLFSYQNMRTNSSNSEINFVSSWSTPDFIADSLDIHIFDLDDTGTINIAYDYKTAKYTLDDICSIHARILHIINQILENEEIVLKDIEIVTPDEKKKLLYDFNDTKMDYPKDKTITELFEEQVEKSPNDLAVVFENKKLTYKELNEKVNSLASYLNKKGITRGDIVGIMVPRSLEMFVGILAILKAGACYVPIDPEYPQDRIQYMLQNSNSKILLTFNSLKNKVLFKDIIYIELSNELYESNKTNLDCINKPCDLAYIIYTSGSTGNPKGVMITHQNINNFIQGMCSIVNFEKQKTIVSVTTISFDIFVLESLLPLIKGLKIIIANEFEQNDGNLFNKLCIENNVKIIQTTPSRFQILIDNSNSPDFLNNLSDILVGGEALPKTLLEKFKKLASANIYNVYGPTETTVWSTVKDETHENNITIGKPIANTKCYILDNNKKLLPYLTPGNLYIGGDGLSKGYLRNPNLTNLKFVNNPFSNNSLIYETGDLAYITSNGELVHLGRNDFQVKINGHRIELEEIENAILKNKNIKQCIVVKKDVPGLREFLCAYYVSSAEIDISTVRNAISKHLPTYMVPQYFVKLDSFPYTPNGKIDKKNLPAPKINFDNKNVIISARNNIDSTLILLLQDLLEVEKISIDDSFFELGGDSLSAINFCTKIYSKFNVQLFARDILENPIIKDLSDLISSKSKNKFENEIKKISESSYYPASSAQSRIYFASTMATNNPTLYNISGGLILDKMPDTKKLNDSFIKLISRHSSLRTSFAIEDNKVIQKIKEKFDFKLNILDKTISEYDIDKEFKLFDTPFNLSDAPLLKASIVKLDNDKAFLMVSTHHIVCDGTSLSILINNLCKIYNNETLEVLKYDYKDYSMWEQKQDYKEAEDFWLQQFQEEIPTLSLPTKPRPPMQSFDGDKIYTKIDKKTFNKINQLSQKLGVTPYMILLSAYYILLYKYTGQKNIIIGSPIANRNRNEFSNIIGMFVNSLALKSNIDSNLNFEQFLNGIKNNCLEAYKYQYYPFDELVNKLNIQRDTSRNPLFDTMFVYQNNGYDSNSTFNGIHYVTYIPHTNISKFDLSLEIIPNNNGLNLSFEYCTKLFDKPFVENLANHYLNIITAALEDTSIKIANIDMLSEKEKNTILYDFNNTKLNYAKFKTIKQLFEEQAQKTPDDIAVVFEKEKLTYNELNEKANSLAHYLLSLGINKGDTIPVLLDRSDYLIISMLAVVKLGAIYLPISSDYPIERINYILDNSSSKYILTHSSNNIILDDNIKEIYVDTLNYSKNNNNPTTSIDPSSILYILYTSGSTGNPKGVAITHKNLNNFINSFNNLFKNINSSSRVLASTNICFDVSIFEFYISLLNGACLYLYEENTITDIIKYCNSIIKNKINTLYIPPNILNEVYQILEKNSYKNLEHILLGVEPIKSNIIKKYYELNPNVQIINAYGPTETTICATALPLNAEILNNYPIVPIGKPLYNLNTYILDDNLNICPIGVNGELYISGDNVGKGYIYNKDLQQNSFVKIPYANSISYKTGDIVKWNSDGTISFIGRNDSQVKINGHRIELGEIEKIIYSYPNIEKCVIIISKDNKINAYYSSSMQINTNDLKAFLQTKLPYYFIPTSLIQVSKFKLTANGKIDKEALKRIKYKEINDFEEAHTEDQKELVSIFKSVLNLDNISINDNFFELGGDSLAAIKLQIEFFNRGINISYKNIFEFPTIKQLSEKMTKELEVAINSDNYDYSKINELLNKKFNINNPKKEKIKNILLTGSTGFLGSHILDSLLKNTRCNIYCLIRSKKNTDPQTRLTDILHFYFGTKYDKYIFKRIFVIEGDISKKNLGLSSSNYIDFGSNIDCVINSAAIVKHYGSSNLFNETNIIGTENIIDFCTKFNCKLIHCSTLSVCGNIFESNKYTVTKLPENSTFSESNLFIGQDLSNIYIYTKFIAERLILEKIINNNLNAKIIRLGNITNRYSDGMFQVNVSENAFLNRIKSFLKIECIPEYIADGYAEFSPVDICADAIVKLTMYTVDAPIFHVYNNNHVYFKDLIKMFKSFNIQIDIVDNKTFTNTVNKIINNPNLKNNLSGIINDFDTNKKLVYDDSNIKIQNTFTNKLLRNLFFRWPKIDKKYIKKYLIYLRSIGYLD